MAKKYNIELSLGYSDKTYSATGGNGKAIPQFKLSKKEDKIMSKTKRLNLDGQMEKVLLIDQMVPKLKPDGSQEVKDLDFFIQQQKDSTNYKKWIDDTGSMDLETIQFTINQHNPNSEAFNYFKDFTNFGDIETLKSMENWIINKYGSMTNFNKTVEKQMKETKSNFDKQKKIWEDYKKKQQFREQYNKLKAEENNK